MHLKGLHLQQQLIKEVIPTFAMRINQKAKKLTNLSYVQLHEKLQVAQEMHREGINMR